MKTGPILVLTVLCSLLIARHVASQSLVHSLPEKRHVESATTDFRKSTLGSRSTDAPLEDDIRTIHNRRITIILDSLTASTSTIDTWIDSLNSGGQWPDIDYTTGCAARRANWPAQDHWARLATMASAWRSTDFSSLEGNETLASKISLAMNWWFDRDFTNIACLDSGGTDACPCNDPNDSTMWNTNWFSNVIGIPEKVGQTCLLMDSNTTTSVLSADQRAVCSRMTGRSYEGGFIRILNIGPLTGANTLDVAKIGIDNALLNSNISLLTDAFARVHAEVIIRNTTKADGVRADGSFGQHAGLLYNGNYGKDYTNDVVDLELEAANTQFSAPPDSRQAMETLFGGDAWMAVLNTVTGTLHWDLSVVGRFISFPVADNQATGSINLNLTKIHELGQAWSSEVLINFADSLSSDAASANAGQLEGSRIYVSTVKMYSSRTKNTECTNSQNPLGFHLADGTTYTYIIGDEYEDIAASWDWQLIPGTTVDYGGTPLSCAQASFTGVEKFVGGVSNGRIGIATMHYTNPLTKAFSWKKAHFFLDDDVQHVMISDVKSSSVSETPTIYSVLDQKRHTGQVFVDGMPNDGDFNMDATGSSSLWHRGIGYTFDPNVTVLSLDVGLKTGNWTAIGISTQPPPVVDLFAAKLQHISPGVPVSYTAYPGTDSYESFVRKSQTHQFVEVQNNSQISAIYDQDHSVAMAVFWDEQGGSVDFETERIGCLRLSVTGNAAIIYDLQAGAFTVADPSQTLSSIDASVDPDDLAIQGKKVTIALPTGGLAGSSVTVQV
ncbi:chondroitin AC/alginate lyase [Dendrothele bispora CBS 962.96]|uniref:Chondroitin AC/alginate lyase n=1 Tax=Dendrothele bispora (strain CBS 962.96) TaxID=1314807 RepID=A0A4V4HI24_DENBC|nr:chondroitin AC/alginate lyase [Dendrothele bispora CBS 962.96]